MPDEKWTISNGPGQAAVGAKLDGYIIKKTAGHYELHGKLATGGANLPVTFSNVTIGGQTWDITVDTLPSATDAGSWSTPAAQLRDGDTPPTQGDFTAQTGGEPVEEAAASASHGKQ